MRLTSDASPFRMNSSRHFPLLFAVEVGVDAPLVTVLQARYYLFCVLVVGGDEYAADLTDEVFPFPLLSD